MTETISVFEVEACSALASCAVAEAAIAAKTAAKAEVENLIMSGLPLINGWKRCRMDGAGKLGFARAV